jgi:hypothetical protein
MPADDIRTVFRVVPVDMLPPPRHLRFPCGFEAEHVRLVEELGDERVAFERFRAELGPRLRECWYHRVSWPVVIDAAIAAFGPAEEAPREAWRDLASAAERIARALGADGETLECLDWLFAKPIQVVDEGRFLQDGQRRVCVLKSAGIGRCPVLVDA